MTYFKKEQIAEITKRLNQHLENLANRQDAREKGIDFIKETANFCNNEKINRENYQYWMSFMAKNSVEWQRIFIDNATTATYVNS
jgi:hypothetical protein